MGFFDQLKNSASKFIAESGIGKSIAPVVQEALEKIEGTSAEVLGNEDMFRAKLSDKAYNHLPAGAQEWIKPDQWHKFLFGIKHSIFTVEQNHVMLQPQFKAAAHEFVQRLLHGENPKAVAEPASAAQKKESETP